MDIDTTRDFGYMSEEVFDLVAVIKQGEKFLDVYAGKLLKNGTSLVDVLGYLSEAKTYFNLELKKRFPSISGNAKAYEMYANCAFITAGYIRMIDEEITNLKNN